jgi:acyl dehydratase
MKTLYFEDFGPGDHFESPGITITEAAIIDFAMHFDPQPFHMDREAAKESIYGGLIASGHLPFISSDGYTDQQFRIAGL